MQVLQALSVVFVGTVPIGCFRARPWGFQVVGMSSSSIEKFPINLGDGSSLAIG